MKFTTVTILSGQFSDIKYIQVVSALCPENFLHLAKRNCFFKNLMCLNTVSTVPITNGWPCWLLSFIFQIFSLFNFCPRFQFPSVLALVTDPSHSLILVSFCDTAYYPRPEDSNYMLKEKNCPLFTICISSLCKLLLAVLAWEKNCFQVLDSGLYLPISRAIG